MFISGCNFVFCVQMFLGPPACVHPRLACVSMHVQPVSMHSGITLCTRASHPGLAHLCLQGIVGLGPAWHPLQSSGPAFPRGLRLSPRHLPCSWSRLCGWSLGSQKRRSPRGWSGRAWSCGGSCRRSRPPTGASCRPTRKASSGRPSLCSGCRPRSGLPIPAPVPRVLALPCPQPLGANLPLPPIRRPCSTRRSARSWSNSF